jgi:2-dehydro-3-deoxygluconokinase
MIRLAVPDHERLEAATTLDLSIGGTESNVAVALARLGRRVVWLSALPKNPLGRKIAATLRSHGVDISQVVWRADARAGLYFLEPGSPPRPTRVIYDRLNSAVATLDPGSVPYSLLNSARALHLTGITPALTPSCATICQRLTDQARERGTPLIFDVNYRSLLWPPEEAARELTYFLDRVSLLFCGSGDAATIWGLTGSPEDVARSLLARSSAEVVVVTAGDAGAVALTRGGQSHAQPAPQVDVVDPVGAGDAFAAGFLHVWFDTPDDLQAALRSGVALASIQMTSPGDLAIITPTELAEAVAALGGVGNDIVR